MAQDTITRHFGDDTFKVNTHDTMIKTLHPWPYSPSYTITEGSASALLDQRLQAAAVKRRTRLSLSVGVAFVGGAVTVGVYFLLQGLSAGLFPASAEPLRLLGAAVVACICGALIVGLPLAAALAGTRTADVSDLLPGDPGGDVSSRLWDYLTPSDRDRLARVRDESPDVARAALWAVYAEYDSQVKDADQARVKAAQRAEAGTRERAARLLGTPGVARKRSILGRH